MLDAAAPYLRWIEMLSPMRWLVKGDKLERVGVIGLEVGLQYLREMGYFEWPA